MHFDSSIKRLGENKTVVNKNLLNVIENHHREFELVRNFIKGIEGELEVRVPLDEIAFIAMFLCIDAIESDLKNQLPKVIISMHGKSTASSMAETVNSLLGIDTVQAYDMELDKDSRTCYEELKEVVRKNSNDAGVLLLVDMGSLIMFGDLIGEELLVKVRVIDCVTTITALEVARHAEFERDIDVIYNSILNKQRMTLMGNRYKDETKTKKENIIIAACTTGEGSAKKIKKLIEDNINISGTNTEIITAAITSHENISNIIGKLGKDKNIIAVVGSIDPMLYGVPFISITDLIMLNKYGELEKMIKTTVVQKKVEENEDLNLIIEQVFNKLKDKIRGPLLLIDYVSTPIVLEVGSLLLQAKNIDEIYEEVLKGVNIERKIVYPTIKKKKAILTCCYTGMGSAVQIHDILEKSLNKEREEITIIPYDYNKLMKNKKRELPFQVYDVISIIGTENPQIDGVNYIGLEHLIGGEEIEGFISILKENFDVDSEKLKKDLVLNFSTKKIIENLTILDANKILRSIEQAVDRLEKLLDMKLSNNRRFLLYLHTSCMVERILRKEDVDPQEDIEDFIKKEKRKVDIVKYSLSDIEKEYTIEISDLEIRLICDIIFN